ncbi:MAG: hypothetical protein H5U40_06115, partial [Polyangiaceae bacterium]|nr:hypothetical protein [Polyangiaceae bacterium]
MAALPPKVFCRSVIKDEMNEIQKSRLGKPLLFALLCCAGFAIAACQGTDEPAAPNASQSSAEDAASTTLEDGVPDSVEELPTSEPSPNELRINETKRYQVLDGVGTNAYAFPYVNDFGYQWESVRDAFDEVNIEYVRLASWFQFWEPQNDDSDPATTNWDAFDPSGIIANHDVPFAQYLTERGIDVELGVWLTGDWMANGSPVAIRPEMFPELGESIATYLTNMEDKGVPIAITEVQNEPGISAAIRYPDPHALVEAGVAVLDSLDAAGYEDVQLHGPNYHAPDADAAEWAEVWMANDKLRDRTAALSYHTWWRDDFESYDRLRQIAEAN